MRILHSCSFLCPSFTHLQTASHIIFQHKDSTNIPHRPNPRCIGCSPRGPTRWSTELLKHVEVAKSSGSNYQAYVLRLQNLCCALRALRRCAAGMALWAPCYLHPISRGCSQAAESRHLDKHLALSHRLHDRLCWYPCVGTSKLVAWWCYRRETGSSYILGLARPWWTERSLFLRYCESKKWRRSRTSTC